MTNRFMAWNRQPQRGTRVRRLPATLILTAVLAACGAETPDEPAPEAPPRPVRVVAVEAGPAQPTISGSGMIASRDELVLSFKLGGVVERVTVREGDAVKRGQLLATLEATEIDAGVTQAREQADKARRDLERGEGLYEDDVIAREQLDDLRTAASVAAAQLRAAQYNRGYARIEAPLDGRVLRRQVEPHELVTAGQPVMSLSAAAQGFVLRLGVPDRDIVRLAVGDTASIRLDALGEQILSGRVVQLARQADPRSGTFEVEIAIENAPDSLANGLIGRAEIVAGDPGDTLDYVPLSALVEGDRRRVTLFVMSEGGTRASKVERPVAFVEGERAALAQALEPGTRVVTEGAAYLHDGERVRIVE